MNSKSLALSIIIVVTIVSTSTVVLQQQAESNSEFQVQKEEFDGVEWNNEVTKNLPSYTDLDEKWMPLWSDGSKTYISGENPTLVRKTIAGNEILSTSYNYVHKNDGTYQILIWKGELVSNWVPKEAIENVFLQTDAKTEKILENLDLIPNCVAAYYDYYGDTHEVENELLFSECAKEDYRVRVTLIEGEFNQESIEKIVFLSNLVMSKI